jgi:hypothetical protein
MIKNFYPTPKELSAKMIRLIDGAPKYILEPSAGRGDIIEAVTNSLGKYRKPNISAIEINPDLAATLRGKNIKVIDSDFLAFAGPDKFDLIIGNPPFDRGADHLLKAIDILYSGQIIFLLNAETLRNLNSNKRNYLWRRLMILDAKIEFIDGAFLDAERKTAVDVALVNIKIKRIVENDLFEGCTDTAQIAPETVKDQHEVTTKDNLADMVADFNQRLTIGQKTIVNFFQNYKKISRWIELNDKPNNYQSDKNLTSRMRNEVNDFAASLRKYFWEKSISLDVVASRMTQKKYDQFHHKVKDFSLMDFTENNVRQFVLNVIENYPKSLSEATLEIFDKFTVAHAWNENMITKNIHYFDGWKTNKAFKCNHKVIIPMRSSYGNPWANFSDRFFSLDHKAAREIDDIDLVMAYFSGSRKYRKLTDSIRTAFDLGENRNIESTHFIATCYKKGTLHLKFKDKDVLRRFNIAACKGKNWLPQDYGFKPRKELNWEERKLADSFDGKDYKPENDFLKINHLNLLV